MAGRKLDDLIIGLQLTTKALEQGMNDVKKKLNQHSNETKRAAKGYDELAIVAGMAFYKIVGAVNSGVKAFNDYKNALTGLRSIAEGTGNSFSEAQRFMESFTKDGLIPANNAATALKNLLARGFSMNEAADIMGRFKDSAAFGRQAALTLGEAVQSATEGLKNENSILVDNAGVTKNVSKMWEEYAATIGKSADSLTIAEKRQAEFAGIMKETQHQVGDAAKYSKEFSGAQARAAAETLKLQQALGGSIVPTLGTIYSLVTPLISLTTEFIQKNPVLSATIITMVTTLAALTTGTLAVVSAFKVLKPAIAAVTAVMATNPVILAITAGLVALAGIITVITAAVQKAKKAQEEYDNALKEHNKIVQEGITKSEIPVLQEKVDKLKELSVRYDEINNKLKAVKDQASGLDKVLNFAVPFYGLITKNAQAEISQYSGQLKDLADELKRYGVTQDTVNQFIVDYETAIKEANRITALEYNEQAKSISQKRAVIVETQNLIKAYKSAQTGTKEWYDAQQKLAEQFPQFSSASGIAIDAIEKVTTAQETAIRAEWDMMKAKIIMTKIDLQNIITTKVAALEALEAQQKFNDSLNEMLTGKKRERPVMENSPVNRARSELMDLRNELKTLGEFEGLDIDKVLGIKPIVNDIDFKAYENAALNSALRIHDHKVALEQLSKEQELKDLQDILKAYAKTADERMDLEERIFRVKQEIRDKDLVATQKAIDDETKKLASRTSNSERWIDREKSRGNLTGQEEIDAYNRIIKYHKEYLAKIVADKKISQEEKNKIIAEETKYIQDQQDKIYDIQKASVEKAVNAYLDAKKKQYATEEELENDRLNKKLKDLDKEYRDKENALKAADRNNELQSLYAEEKKYQNAATKAGQDKLKEIRDRIAALNKETTQDALDAEKQSRQDAINQAIEDNKTKYKKLNDVLDTEGKALIAASATYAKQSNDEIIKGQSTIANSLKSIMINFDKDSTNLITKGMENLKKLIDGYKKIMDGFSMSPMDYKPSAESGTVAAKQAQGVTVNVNDYGAKIINSKDEAIDYTKELFATAKNAARTAGGIL
jgi:hypothetical protein